MIERIRYGLRSIRQRLRPRRAAALREAPLPVKGSMRSIIVVKPENPAFSEAFFVLSDEYVHQRGVSSQELLRQAREAAARCGAPVKCELSPGLRWLGPVLSVAAAVLVCVGFFLLRG